MQTEVPKQEYVILALDTYDKLKNAQALITADAEKRVKEAKKLAEDGNKQLQQALIQQGTLAEQVRNNTNFNREQVRDMEAKLKKVQAENKKLQTENKRLKDGIIEDPEAFASDSPPIELPVSGDS